jgi:hypothetical protein
MPLTSFFQKGPDKPIRAILPNRRIDQAFTIAATRQQQAGLPERGYPTSLFDVLFAYTFHRVC